MGKKRLVMIMVILATIGVIAGFFRLGGDLAEKTNHIIGVIIGIYIMYFGFKIGRTSPDKTVNIIRPVKLCRLFIACGVMILAVNLIVAVAGFTTSESRVLAGYVNRKYNIAINPPKKWIRTDFNTGGKEMRIVSFTSERGNGYGNIIIGITRNNLHSAEMLRRGVEVVIENLQSIDSLNFEFISKDPCLINGVSGYGFEALITDEENGRVHQYQFLLPKGNVAYHINCKAKLSEYSAVSSAFETAIESFRILE